MLSILAICIFSGRNVYSSSLPFFLSSIFIEVVVVSQYEANSKIQNYSSGFFFSNAFFIVVKDMKFTVLTIFKYAVQ